MTELKFFSVFTYCVCMIMFGIVLGSLIGLNNNSTITVDHHQCIIHGAGLSQTMSCDFDTQQQRGK